MPRPFAILLCGIGALVVVLGLRLSRLGRETRGYTRTSGRVVAAHVEEIPGSAEEGGPRFRPIVRYSYEARGRRYESDRISVAAPAGDTTPDREEAHRQVARHPQGSEVDVWFDPRDPARSVLVRGVATAQVIAAIAIGLALVGLGIFSLAR